MARYKAKALLEIETESWSKDALENRWAELMRLGIKLFGANFRESLRPDWEEVEKVVEESGEGGGGGVNRFDV